MQAYVKESYDSNATFKALEEYYKGDYKLEKISDISFSSERKWSSITFRNLGTVIVGAPERLIEKSHEKELPKIVTEAQKDGKRALCVAFTKKEMDMEELPELDIVASIILTDPLRKNAKEMLGYFKTQDVDIKIISGDNPITKFQIF